MVKRHNHVLRFVLLLGVISLFADMTYESARSITGPYLAILGASTTTVCIVAGLGELVGYGLRIASGVISDRTHRYWAITIAGYAVNLLAVPAQNKNPQVKYVNLSTKANIAGTTTDIFIVRNYSLSKGRFFDEDKDNAQYLLDIKNIQFYLNLFLIHFISCFFVNIMIQQKDIK